MIAGYRSERLGNHTYTIIPNSHNAVLFLNIYLNKYENHSHKELFQGPLQSRPKI